MDPIQGGSGGGQQTGGVSLADVKPDESQTPTIYPNPTKGFGAMVGTFDTEVPETQSKAQASLTASTSDLPVPVVKVLSVRGVEYLMMSFALWFGAGGLIWILLSLIYGNSGFSDLAFPVSLLMVCLPIFGLFFLRLRKQELANPELKLEASKRRLSQTTQILAFLVCLGNLVSFVYMMMAKLGGESKASFSKSILGLLAILAVAGGILIYYWFDEHRNVKG